jgi:hypothetical protein
MTDAKLNDDTTVPMGRSSLMKRAIALDIKWCFDATLVLSLEACTGCLPKKQIANANCITGLISFCLMQSCLKSFRIGAAYLLTGLTTNNQSQTRACAWAQPTRERILLLE